jgi:hypothetical protein
MRDKFVSLEQEKCQLLYLLARSSGARNIVEAGTSFGVSTIYLALAVGQNVADARAATGKGVTGKVIATEKEPSKAARARDHWKEAGDEIEPWIELREGDLLETLKVEEGMPEQIDLLLLDSKFPRLSVLMLLPVHPWRLLIKILPCSLDTHGVANTGNYPAEIAQGRHCARGQHRHGQATVQGVSRLRAQLCKWVQNDDHAVLGRAADGGVSTSLIENEEPQKKKDGAVVFARDGSSSLMAEAMNQTGTKMPDLFGNGGVTESAG